MPRNGIKMFVLIVLSALILSGCAMLGENIPPEQLAKLATVEGADGYPLHSVDSNKVLFTSSVNVSPGMHDFELIASCSNNNCSYLSYRFNAQAGNLYRLMPNRSVAVLDRNDRFQRKLDELTPVNRGGVIEYVNRAGQQENARVVVNQAQAERAATLEHRKQQLPFVRRVGAKICQVQGQTLYVGFVEALTDDKVQVRVGQALINDNRNLALTNFKPQIVWDSPLNWDLCE